MVALSVLAIAFVPMPFAVQLQDRSMILIYIAGSLFWMGLIGSVMTAIHIDRARKQSAVFQELFPDVKQCGLTHFFQNMHAIKADIALFASLLALIVCSIWGDQIGIFVCIACVIFALGMHCMLNSINYVYINHGLRR